MLCPAESVTDCTGEGLVPLANSVLVAESTLVRWTILILTFKDTVYLTSINGVSSSSCSWSITIVSGIALAQPLFTSINPLAKVLKASMSKHSTMLRRLQANSQKPPIQQNCQGRSHGSIPDLHWSLDLRRAFVHTRPILRPAKFITLIVWLCKTKFWTICYGSPLSFPFHFNISTAVSFRYSLSRLESHQAAVRSKFKQWQWVETLVPCAIFPNVCLSVSRKTLVAHSCVALEGGTTWWASSAVARGQF